MIKQFDGATRCVQVMPLDEEGLPLPEIYGSVLVEEDLTAMKKTRRPDEPSGRKTLESINEMFHVKDKLAKRIFLRGEAGHGKTVLCLKILESWSETKKSMRDAAVEIDSKEGDKQSKRTQGDGSERGTDERLGGTGGSKASSSHQTNLELASTEHHKSKDSQSCFPSSASSSSSSSANDDDAADVNEEKELQSSLSKFDLVFYVPLRHAKQSTSIVDLVCDSVSECDQNTKEKIKELLGNASIPCLVILDGLDEWRAPETCRMRGFPDKDGMVNCALLCSMRPWRMVNLQLGLDNTCDKVVEILGLKGKSVKRVISNVLVYFFGLETTTLSYKQKFKHFRAKAKLQAIKPMMRIPLMLTASCLVWNEEDEDEDLSDINSESLSVVSEDNKSDSDSSLSVESDHEAPYFMTFFYLKLTEVTITRAENKYDIVRSFLVEKREEKQQNPKWSLSMPCILCKFDPIIDFFEIIKIVGRLALQDLVSEEPHLVFPKNKLEREIGYKKVELALRAGILSQTKALGLSYQQRVCVSFYHKSLQECIAALYMACGETDSFESFCKRCNSVDKVMELSNMIRFLCGLNPVLGCQLSKHIAKVVDCDADIIEYREGRDVNADRGCGEGKVMEKVREVYWIQCTWFNEIKQNQLYTEGTDDKPTFHVTDVCLGGDFFCDTSDVRTASEMVSMKDNSIVSIYLADFQYPINSIIQCLPGCKRLTSLYIDIVECTQEDTELLANVLPQLVHLQRLTFISELEDEVDSTTVVHAALQLQVLKSLQLSQVKIMGSLVLPQQLQEVMLSRIRLTHTVTLSSMLKKLVLESIEAAHFILSSLCGCIQLKTLKLRSINLTDQLTLPSLLESVELCNIGKESPKFILPSLCQCSQLKYLQLRSITLVCTVTLPPLLETVELKLVRSAHYILLSLPKCTQLTTLNVFRLESEDDREMMANVLPQLLHLQYLHYGGKFGATDVTNDVAVVNNVQLLSKLKYINLWQIPLGDAGSLLISPQMTQIEEIELEAVSMSARRWKEFVDSLSIKQTIFVNLLDTNIDVDTENTIHKSKEKFKVSRCDERQLSGDARSINMAFSTVV